MIKNKLKLLVLFLFVFSLINVVPVSAAIVTTSYWVDNGGTSVTITEGESAELFVWISTTKDGIEYEINLLDNNYDLVSVIASDSFNGKEYWNYFTITESDYGEEGNYIIRVIGEDGSYSDYEDLSLTVNPSGEPPEEQNNAPELDSIGSKSVDEGNKLTIPISASDADGDCLSFSILGNPYGASFVDNGDGTADFSWQTDYSDAGTYYVTFTVSDGNLDAYEVVKITVNDVPQDNGDENTAPELKEIGNKETVEGAKLSFTVSASDEDGDELSFSASGLPSGASFTSGGYFSWQTDYSDAGYYYITFTVSDGELEDSETIKITVKNTEEIPDPYVEDGDDGDGNNAPVIYSIGYLYGEEDREFYYNVDAYDVDGDSLSFSDDTSLFDIDSSTGEIRFTPDWRDVGTYEITITVSDGKGGYDTEQFTLRIHADYHYVWDDDEDNYYYYDEDDGGDNYYYYDEDDSFIYYNDGKPFVSGVEETDYNWGWISLIAFIIVVLGVIAIYGYYKNCCKKRKRVVKAKPSEESDLPQSYY